MTESARDVLARIDTLAGALMGAIAASGERRAGEVCSHQSGGMVTYEIERDDLVFGKAVVEELLRAGWEFTAPEPGNGHRA